MALSLDTLKTQQADLSSAIVGLKQQQATELEQWNGVIPPGADGKAHQQREAQITSLQMQLDTVTRQIVTATTGNTAGRIGPLTGNTPDFTNTVNTNIVNQQLLESKGINVPPGTATTVTVTNGVATITVPDGRTIKVPADDYATILNNQQLVAQDQANRTVAYNAWVNSNSQFGAPGSQASLQAFANQDQKQINQGGSGLYSHVINPVAFAGALAAVNRSLTVPVSLAQPGTSGTGVNNDPSLQTAGPVSLSESQRVINGTAGTSTAPPVNNVPTTNRGQTPTANNNTAVAGQLDFQTSKPSPDNPLNGGINIQIGDGSQSTAPSVGSNSIKVPKVTPNPLDNYDSYTYNISLHLLDKDEWNTIIQTGLPSPKHTLIGGAGRGASRDKNWTENFYFDELRMTTIIGPTQDSRGTNAIDIQFTILEPMGLSFLDRLIQTCSDLGYENHLIMPYLLEIRFYDATSGLIPGTQKWIPIQMLECKIKVTQRGSEYRVRAIPYVHGALTQMVQSTPANFNVAAKTADQYFYSSSSNPSATFTQREQLDALLANTGPTSGAVRTPNTVANTNNNSVNTANYAALDTVYSVRSYVDAYNFWQYQLAQQSGYADNQKIDDPFSVTNDIQVVISPAFSSNPDNLTLIDPSQQTPTNTPMGSTAKSRTTPTPAPMRDLAISQVRAGTLVSQVINNVMGTTKYVQNQLADPATGVSTNPNFQGPLGWWKIIPTVKLKNFSNLTNKWAMTVTYNVVPYIIDNVKHPLAPQRIIDPSYAVKSYQYLYTGLNTSVIDLQMDFDFTYFVALTVKMAKSQIGAGDRVGAAARTTESGTAQSGDGSNASTSATPSPNPTPRWTPLQYGYKGETGTGGAFNKRNDTQQIVANSVADSVYSKSTGDMLLVKLKINGDPDFIKQDEILITPLKDIANYNSTSPNNSLNMDTQEVIVNITVRVPVDYDETTGQVTMQGMSGFSGVYKVLTVDNYFKGGKFEQTLDCTRYFNQIDTAGGSANSTTALDQRKNANTSTTPVKTSQVNVANGGAVNTTVGAVQNTTKEDVVNTQLARINLNINTGNAGSDQVPPAEVTTKNIQIDTRPVMPGDIQTG